MSEEPKLTRRQRAAIIILLFIVKILNPTGYDHQLTHLKEELLALLNDSALEGINE